MAGHVGRAVGGLQSVLELINGAVIFADRTRAIAGANTEARMLLAEGTLLRAHDRVLVPQHPEACHLFDEIARQRWTHPVAKKCGERLMWLVPLSEGDGGLVVVVMPGQAPSMPVPILMKAFGLTAAEARVLAALASGRSIADIAGAFGISARTVKAHLQKLFDKTGTRRQADLLRSVMDAIPALRVF